MAAAYSALGMHQLSDRDQLSRQAGGQPDWTRDSCSRLNWTLHRVSLIHSSLYKAGMRFEDPRRCGRRCEDVKTEVHLVFDKLFGAVYARWAAPRVLLDGGARCWTLDHAGCSVHLSISDDISFVGPVRPARGWVSLGC